MLIDKETYIHCESKETKFETYAQTTIFEPSPADAALFCVSAACSIDCTPVETSLYGPLITARPS